MWHMQNAGNLYPVGCEMVCEVILEESEHRLEQRVYEEEYDRVPQHDG